MLWFWHLQRGEAYEEDRADSDLTDELNEARLNALGHRVRQVRSQHILSSFHNCPANAVLLRVLNFS